MALLDSLKRLKWLKYLFVDSPEAQAEQDYWRNKQRRHIALDHTPGIITGLDVQATSPASLSVTVTAGRAIDVNGDDPCLAVDTVLNLAGLVPSSGSRLVYIVILYAETEEDSYFVPELGGYQNKYLAETPILRAQTTVPAGAEIELARVALTAGQTAIATAQIDKSYRVMAGAANAMKKTGDVATGEQAAPSFRATGQFRSEAPQGTAPFVVTSTTKNVNLNADLLDGYHADPGTTGNTIPVRGSDGKIPGTAAGADNADTVDNKHAADFAPITHVGAGGTAHPTATQATAGFLSGADKAKLDSVQSGAEVNQNAFSTVKVGTTNVAATAKTDIVELVAGGNIKLTPDAANKKITVALDGVVPSASNADTLDGRHADAGTTANTIPVRDSNGKLPGSITGDADTVDGKHVDAGTTASTIPVRDSSGKLPGSITGDAHSVDGYHADPGITANTLPIRDSSGSVPGSITGDAHSVDGYHADPGTGASTVPVRDASGKLPGSITGDANTVDGYHANAGVVASTIPVRDGSGKVPGSITGDADTLDGYHANTGAVASTVPVRDGSGKVPGSITGDADTVDGRHAGDFLLLSGGNPAGTVNFNVNSTARLVLPVGTDKWA